MIQVNPTAIERGLLANLIANGNDLNHIGAVIFAGSLRFFGKTLRSL